MGIVISMLESLFGNKTIQKVLLFLFVNGKGYGTQLHKHLKTPLTPLQKALNRLEKGNLIVSYQEGKTKLYQFNPSFPLMAEIEQLLRKTYTLLPPKEKKLYFLFREETWVKQDRPISQAKIIQTFWEKLATVELLTFSAQSKIKEGTGWNGMGKGEVTVKKIDSKILIFNEKGSWTNIHGAEIDFTNTFRWTLDREAGLISLEHLRHGNDQPVLLFHLTPSSDNSLSSVDSYFCGGDIYFGKIQFDMYGLKLNWRVIGSKKNEEINYFYSGKAFY